MNIKQELQRYDDIGSNHFFHFNEGLKALQEMISLVCDFSEGSSERFAAAQERLELSRSRANKEFQRLKITEVL